MNDLEKLFVSELKDIYDGESQLVDALPALEKTAASGELRRAFRHHLEQTRQHVQRLEAVFRTIGQEPKRKACKGMEGIIDEGQTMAKEFADNSALDAALITGAQKVEHYEITAYGSLCTWAKEIGNKQALALLKETLAEEKETDQKLSQLAKETRNPEATRHDTKKKGDLAAKLSKMGAHGP